MKGTSCWSLGIAGALVGVWSRLLLVPYRVLFPLILLLCCIGVWVFLWHTPWGYALRTMGHNPEAAVYAGTNLRHMTMLAMCISGGLAGFVGVNELMGVHHRIVLDFPAGYGFAGIAYQSSWRIGGYAQPFVQLRAGAARTTGMDAKTLPMLELHLGLTTPERR